MSLTSIVAIALIIFGFVIIATFMNIFKEAQLGSNKEIISTWVSTTNAKLSIEEGTLQDTGYPPVPILYPEPVKIYEEETFTENGNEIIVDAMLDCWGAFHHGKLPFLGKDYKEKNFCFPCAQVKFSKEIKNKYDSLEKVGEYENRFTNYLNQPINKESKKTYMDIFDQKLIYTKKIKDDEDPWIFFVDSKGNFLQRFLGEVSESQKTDYFIPGRDLFVAIASPYGKHYPSIIFGYPEEISKICNSESIPKKNVA